MKKPGLSLLVLSLLFLPAAVLDAQVVERTFMKVTAEGAEAINEKLNVSECPHDLFSPLTTPPGLKWNYTDGGLVWIPKNISVGDRGTQALGIFELNNERIELFSTVDGNPPTPIWSDLSIHGTDTGYGCDSSFKPHYHVAMYHVNSPDLMNRIPHVDCYTSSSSTPIWSWSYPTTINAGTKVAIDRDATVVAVAVFNDSTSMVELFFFDPATGASKGTYSHAGGYIRGFGLSSDGSTLYYHENGLNVHIFDIATLTEVYSTSTSGSFDGHCISGDGTKFAFSGFGTLKLFEYIGSSWTSFTFNTGSGNYPSTLAISDDNSTLGFGVQQYSPNNGKTEAYIMDIATKTITTHETYVSNGVYQDACADCAISPDGKYFVLGRWGDQLNVDPEVQILENGVGVIGTIDTRGSVFSVDLSWDAQVVVAGSKAIHANVSGKGGDMDCYRLGGEDMELGAPPHVGSKVPVNVYTDPNWYYALILGSADVPTGFASFPFGTLYLDSTWPNVFMILPVLTADPSGVGSVNLNIPNNPIFIGATAFLQALVSPNGSSMQLTKDYLTLTGLP